jgi:hypothetical protein
MHGVEYADVSYLMAMMIFTEEESVSVATVIPDLSRKKESLVQWSLLQTSKMLWRRFGTLEMSRFSKTGEV